MIYELVVAASHLLSFEEDIILSAFLEDIQIWNRKSYELGDKMTFPCLLHFFPKLPKQGRGCSYRTVILK